MATTIINTIKSLQKTYVDLDINFLTNPGTGDITIKKNVESIKQSIRNLLMTKMYERPFQANLYSGIYDLLFENFTGTTKYTLEKIIRNLLSTYEPRINVIDVNIIDNSVMNGLDISLTFEVISLSIITTYSVTLERTR